MKKVILAMITTLILITSAWATDPQLLIEYAMEPAESISEVAEFRLYVIKVPGSGVKDLIGTWLSDPLITEWTDTYYDLPIGKTLNYYLESVDKEGDTAMSPPYAFKITGQAVIISIRRVKTK